MDDGMKPGGNRIFLDFLAIFIAIVAAGTSIKSCQVSEEASQASRNAVEISKDSNKIAQEALETSRVQFSQLNRPRLLLNPKKFDDGIFWKIEQDKKQLIIRLKYEVKNVGNVAAKDIKLPNKACVGPVKEGNPLFYRKPGKVTLGPEGSFNIEPTMVMAYESEEEAKINYQNFLSDESKGVTLQLPLNYVNELDESQKYRTLVENKIFKNRVIIVKSEMSDLPKEMQGVEDTMCSERK